MISNPKMEISIPSKEKPSIDKLPTLTPIVKKTHKRNKLNIPFSNKHPFLINKSKMNNKVIISHNKSSQISHNSPAPPPTSKNITLETML